MKQQSIKKNYFYNTFYQILNLITPLITAPYTARVFQADGVGIQSYVMSIVVYFTMFAGLGTSSYGQRKIAMFREDKKEASKLFWEIELLSVLTTSICLIAWLIFIIVSHEYTKFYLVLTMNILAVMFDITWFFNAYEQFKITVTRNTIIKLIGIAVLFIFVREKDDLLFYIAMTSATGLLGALSLWTYLPKYVVKVKFRNMHLMEHFKETFIYFVPTIATTIYTIFDKTMIGVITKNSFENGYYEQTTKITKMSMTIITSLNTVMASRMSFLFHERRYDEIKDRLRKSIDFVMLLSIPMVLGIIGVSDNFVDWFFGSGYEKVSDLLIIYSPLIIVIGISNCLAIQYVIPKGDIKKSNKGVIFGAVINFCLNIILIPRLQSIGAALASVVAETIITLVFIYLSRDCVTIKTFIEKAWKKIIAGALMFAAIIFIKRIPIMGIPLTMIEILVGVGLYFSTLVLIKDEMVINYIEKYLRKAKKWIKN